MHFRMHDFIIALKDWKKTPELFHEIENLQETKGAWLVGVRDMHAQCGPRGPWKR
jgi:hypothetical protein